jgi:hypothetical protein
VRVCDCVPKLQFPQAWLPDCVAPVVHVPPPLHVLQLLHASQAQLDEQVRVRV